MIKGIFTYYLSISVCVLLFTLSGFAQYTSFNLVPYYGKNKIIYEIFKWKHYLSKHFDVYYYTDKLETVEMVANTAEYAYTEHSQLLKHHLNKRIPIIFYATHTDFEQTNLYPYQVPEGVMGFAEPIHYRIVVQGDLPIEQLHDLIEHELSHIFQYSILYSGQISAMMTSRQPPLWVFEGLSEYCTHVWRPMSLLAIRDAVLNDTIPELTKDENLRNTSILLRNPAYDFGHAIYDFIEYKYGKNGIKRFWDTLSKKRNILMKNHTPLKVTFGYDYREFNRQFKQYLRKKFSVFFSKENPDNYSVAIGPAYPVNEYIYAISYALSPTGEVAAILTVNIKEMDIDIALFSMKDGTLIKNLTKGHTYKYENIKTDFDFFGGGNISWAPDGDTIAFFGRTGQKHSLFIINAMSGKISKQVEIGVNQPSSPFFLSDNKTVLFTAYDEEKRDIFQVNYETEKITNLTDDDLYEGAPAVSPDGNMLAYVVGVGDYSMLILSPISNLGKKIKVTKGEENITAPYFSSDSKKIYFSSDKAGAFNIQELNLETGELKQYTDVKTGNFYPRKVDSGEFVFLTFYKGVLQLYKTELKENEEKTLLFDESTYEELKGAEEVFPKTLVNEEKIEEYKGLEKLMLSRLPSSGITITTDGAIWGTSTLTLSDLLGDYSVFLSVYQIRNFSSYYGAFLNQRRRLQYMAGFFSFKIYYYPSYYYYYPEYVDRLTYRDAIATRSTTGLFFNMIYPLNKYYRFQTGISFYNYKEEFLEQLYRGPAGSGYGNFWDGNWAGYAASLIGETTRFNYYGPMAGHTFKLELSQAIPVAGWLQNTTAEIDIRKYLDIGSGIHFAVKWEAFISRGKNSFVFYYGGNNQVRSANYLSLIANECWFLNTELRFPVLNIYSSLFGYLGPIRGTLFFDLTRLKVKGYSYKFYSFEGIETDEAGFTTYRFRSADAIGSIGYGFEFFILGIPLHLEFVKRLEIPNISNPFDFKVYGDFRTKFWIGFDF